MSGERWVAVPRDDWPLSVQAAVQGIEAMTEERLERVEWREGSGLWRIVTAGGATHVDAGPLREPPRRGPSR